MFQGRCSNVAQQQDYSFLHVNRDTPLEIEASVQNLHMHKHDIIVLNWKKNFNIRNAFIYFQFVLYFFPFFSCSTLSFRWQSLFSFTRSTAEDKNTGSRGLRLAINSNTTAVNQDMHHKLQPVLKTSCGRHLLVTKVFTCLNNQLHGVLNVTSLWSRWEWTAATWSARQMILNRLPVEKCCAHEQAWWDSWRDFSKENLISYLYLKQKSAKQTDWLTI